MKTITVDILVEGDGQQERQKIEIPLWTTAELVDVPKELLITHIDLHTRSIITQLDETIQNLVASPLENEDKIKELERKRNWYSIAFSLLRARINEGIST